MSKSLFSNMYGLNEIAIQNIQESEELNFDFKYEDDYTTSQESQEEIFSYIPFEDDITISL